MEWAWLAVSPYGHAHNPFGHKQKSIESFIDADVTDMMERVTELTGKVDSP